VLVLALGICGVTTQFTVVNAFVLRGFSFPHPETVDERWTDRSAGDAAKTIISAPAIFRRARITKTCAWRSNRFRRWLRNLFGSTINVTYRNNPQR